MRQIILIVSMFLLAPLADLVAQDAPSLAPGARVRVSTSTFNRTTWSRNRVEWVGTLMALKADTLVLRAKEKSAPMTIPLSSIAKFEVSRGRKRNIGGGAFFGLLAGTAMGAMVSFAVGRGGDENDYFPEYFIPPFAVLGLLTGTVIGALNPVEQWKQVPPPVRVGIAPQRGGGVRLAASFAF